MVTQLQGGQVEISLWYLFLSGFIGISAMILPGLSGAYIFFVMGVYQTILSYLRQVQDLVFDFDQAVFITVGSGLAVFILGIITGLKVFFKISNMAIRKTSKTNYGCSHWTHDWCTS